MRRRLSVMIGFDLGDEAADALDNRVAPIRSGATSCTLRPKNARFSGLPERGRQLRPGADLTIFRMGIKAERLKTAEFCTFL